MLTAGAPPAGQPNSRVPAVAQALALGVWFLGLAVAGLHPLSTSAERLPDSADGVLFSWVLAWLSHQAPRAPLELFAANIFHPEPAALAYGEPLLGLVPLAWPWYALTGSAIVTYNATLVVTLLLSASFAFLLAKELTGSTLAGVIAGEIFAFSTANFDSAARIQIVSSQWTPLTLYFVVRCLRTRRLRHGLAAGASFALQGLACSYYELYFAVLLLAVGPLLLLAARSLPWKPLAAGAALAALLLLPSNLVQLDRLGRVGLGRMTNPGVTWASYSYALPSNWLYGESLGLPGTLYDGRYFPGLLPLLLAAGGLSRVGSDWRRSRRATPKDDGPGLILAISALAGLAFLLAFGGRIPTPLGDLPGPIRLLYGWVPGLEAARVPSRFIMFVRLGVALLAGVGVARGIGSGAWRRAGVACLAILLPLEHLSAPLPTWTMPAGVRTPPVYLHLREIARTHRPPIAEFPPSPVRLRRREAIWEYLSTFHWLPVVNGFNSYYPAQHDLVYNALLDLPDERAFEVLRTLGVEYLVYHPADPGHEEGRRAIRRFEKRVERGIEDQIELVTAFDAPAARYPEPWSMLGGERLYRIRPRQSPRPRPSRTAELQPLPRRGWRCESQPRHGRCRSALDGDLATYFQTTTPQRDGQYFRVFFPRRTEVRGIALAQGRLSPFYPIGLEVRGLVDGQWLPLPAQVNQIEFLEDMLADPSRAALELIVSRSRVDGLELRVSLDREAFNPWALPELYVYE